MLLLACAIGLGMLSCKSVQNANKLTDRQWMLETLAGKQVEAKEKPGTPFLLFDGAGMRVSGLAGCNRFFGMYEEKAGKLTFSQTGSTRLACPEETGEATFFKMLENTDNYLIKDGKLSLRRQEEVLGVFKGEPLEAPKN